MRDPIDQLLEEHRVIMMQIDDLRAAADELAAHGDEALSNALPVFERVGKMMATQLDLHRHKEDDALFPALEAIFGVDDAPTTVMREEHKAIHAQGALLRQTLHELNEVEHPQIEANADRLRGLAANGGGAASLQSTAEEIIRLLDMHFGKEEDVVFPMAREMLNTNDLQRVAARMAELQMQQTQ